MDKVSTRQSNLEMLRIIAIMMIVMMHGAGCLLGTLFLPNRMILTFINAFGNMGVTTFILISGYFGIRFRWSRLWVLWAIALFYSLMIFFFDVLILGDVFSWQGLYHSLTPVTSQRWWFLTCYVVVFCLAPFLNRAVTDLTKRQMEILLAIMAFFFIISPTILRNTLTNDMEGKGLPNLITAYLIGQYIARYNIHSSFIRYSGRIVIIAVMLVFSASFMAGCIEPRATILFCKDNNLLIVIGAVSMFCWFRKLVFHSETVNYLAGFVFPLYLINLTVFRCFQNMLMVRSGQMEFWKVYLMAIGVALLSALAVEMVRRMTVSRVVDRITRKISIYDFQWDSTDAGSHGRKG